MNVEEIKNTVVEIRNKAIDLACLIKSYKQEDCYQTIFEEKTIEVEFHFHSGCSCCDDDIEIVEIKYEDLDKDFEQIKKEVEEEKLRQEKIKREAEEIRKKAEKEQLEKREKEELLRLKNKYE